jgi:hypothetical protein
MHWLVLSKYSSYETTRYSLSTLKKIIHASRSTKHSSSDGKNLSPDLVGWRCGSMMSGNHAVRNP